MNKSRLSYLLDVLLIITVVVLVVKPNRSITARRVQENKTTVEANDVKLKDDHKILIEKYWNSQIDRDWEIHK